MSELLNLVGLSAGVVLYAMLLAMVVRVGRSRAAPPRFDPLLLVTAVLGLVWNLCALLAYELPNVGVEGPFPFLLALGFSALGFLPAVVVHSVLRGERDGVRSVPKRSIAAVAYAISTVAVCLHVVAAWAGWAVPSAIGMRLLTYAFVALVVPLAAVTRGQPGARRALWAAALATFAVSALHLSQLHQGDASWPVELVGHHASLPLAFAILYQDYPFALADLFLKRALALLALLALAFVAVLMFGLRSTAFTRFVQADPREVGVLVTLWVATALLYPALRRNIGWFVDAVILHRPDYRSLRTVVARRLQAHDDVSRLLSDVCELLAPALSAKGVSWREWQGTRGDEAAGVVVAGREAAALADAVEPWITASDGIARAAQAAAVAVVPTSERPRYAITIAEITGGRRFLSDDVAALEAIVLLVARRIDTIRITNERYERGLREQEIGKLATEAELRALRAQVNPHFLFNALTTIGYLIQTTPPRALQTLMRLTSLLRAVLRSEGEFTTLGRELDVIECLPGHRASPVRAAAACHRGRPAGTASAAGAASGPAADRRERRQAWHRDPAPRRTGAGPGQRGTVRRVICGSVSCRRGYRGGSHTGCPEAGARVGRRAEKCRAPAGVSVRRRRIPVRAHGARAGYDGRDQAAGRGEDPRARAAGSGSVTARLRVVVADDERPARSFLVALLQIVRGRRRDRRGRLGR